MEACVTLKNGATRGVLQREPQPDFHAIYSVAIGRSPTKCSRFEIRTVVQSFWRGRQPHRLNMHGPPMLTADDGGLRLSIVDISLDI